MPFTPKSWGNFSSGGTPLTGASLIDLETRVTDYADDGSQPWINAEARGARFDSDPTFDSRPILQACLDEAAALTGTECGGGTVILPHGACYISNQLQIPAAVRMIGQGKRSTAIIAMNQALTPANPSTFPSNSSVIAIGTATPLIGFDSIIQDMTIDANHIVGSTGIYSLYGAEGARIRSVLIGGFRKYGVELDTCFGVEADDLEIFGSYIGSTPGNGSAIAGFYAHGVGLSGYLSNSTIISENRASGIGVWIHGSQYRVSGIHVERNLDGVKYEEAASGVIENIAALGNINTLHFNNQGRAIAMGITSSEVNTIVDDGFLNSPLTDYIVRFYCQTGIYVGNVTFGGSTNADFRGTTNNERRGEVILNDFLTYPGGPVGWINLASGTPDTWRPFGQIIDVLAIPYSASMTTVWYVENQTITITNGTAMTINAPVSYSGPIAPGAKLTFDILNSSGGAHGAINTNSVFKLVGGGTVLWSGGTITTAHRRTITFYFDGTNWVETARASGDIF